MAVILSVAVTLGMDLPKSFAVVLALGLAIAFACFFSWRDKNRQLKQILNGAACLTPFDVHVEKTGDTSTLHTCIRNVSPHTAFDVHLFVALWKDTLDGRPTIITQTPVNPMYRETPFRFDIAFKPVPGVTGFLIAIQACHTTLGGKPVEQSLLLFKWAVGSSSVSHADAEDAARFEVSFKQLSQAPHKAEHPPSLLTCVK